jgi:hypothetical protein
MNNVPRKASLSEPRRALLELMQANPHGRIECLSIKNGDPVLSPLPRVVREIKFGGENGPRPELAADDFCLKEQVVELFRYFDEIRDRVIAVIEIKHGLPFRMSIVDPAA